MKRILTYATGAFALTIVAAAIVSALCYALTHHREAMSGLATSTLSGVGMAVGGCLGSAIVLRFKAARQFIHNVVKEVK